MSGEELRWTLEEIDKEAWKMLHEYWSGMQDRHQLMHAFDGQLPEIGDTFTVPELPESLREIEKPAHFFVLRGGFIRYMKDETARQEDLAMPEGFKNSERAELALRLVNGRSFGFLETRALLKILAEEE